MFGADSAVHTEHTAHISFELLTEKPSNQKHKQIILDVELALSFDGQIKMKFAGKQLAIYIDIFLIFTERAGAREEGRDYFDDE